ncbi:hypothetical protein [Streptomyces sp. NPDC058291]|jgi:hypothetical protein|uniref:hypothetical protein n=1 Tax=Streptomyces sp. NPDC058291 TaxID=3346427 RepID=UPI0036E620A1
MSLHIQHNADGTVTGHNTETGYLVTSADEEEVRRLVYEDAGWEYTPPPSPTPPGFHRFVLVHGEFGDGGFGDERYERLRSHPPSGCEPVDRGCFALLCERPGPTLLGAVSDTVAEIRRAHGLVMNGLGIEKPDEWCGDDREDGQGARLVAHLLLTAAHRAALLGYGRKDLVRLVDASGLR